MRSYSRNVIVLQLVAALAISAVCKADQAFWSGRVNGSGYLNLSYAWIGSASPATVYNGLRITSSLMLADSTEAVRFSYRSHHSLQFKSADDFIYHEAYRNRSVFHTAFLELNRFLWKNLQVRFGRQFPDMPYSSANPVDGAWMKWTWKGWECAGSAGQAVDAWSGSSERHGLQYGVMASRNLDFVQWSAGYLSKRLFDIQSEELHGGCIITFLKHISLISSLAYEMGTQPQGIDAALSRANTSLSWRSTHGSLSLSGSHWRNSFDQLVVDWQNKDLPYFGSHSEAPPSDYQNVRLAGSYRWPQWSARGTVAYLTGVRSGWLSNAHIELPPVRRIRCGLGGQVTRTDYIRLYAVDAGLSFSYRSMAVKLSSESRIYQWQPNQSGFSFADNHTELELTCPMRDNLYVLARMGAYFRRIGDEETKPLLRATLVYRL